MTDLLHVAVPSTPVARQRSRRRRAIAPVAVGMLGLLVSLAGNTTPSLWFDEAATVSSATRSWPDLVRELGNVDLVHGVYYSFMHVVFALVGYSPESLRFPSAVAVGLAAALLVVLVRQLSTPRLAVFAGGIFCLLPRVTWIGAEGRSFAFTALLAVVLSLLLVRALRVPSWSNWLLYGVVALLACLVFLFLGAVVVAHAVTVALALLRRRENRQQLARRAAVVLAAAGILVVPFAVAASRQKRQVGWIHAPNGTTPVDVLQNQWFNTNLVFALLGWALLLLGVLALVRGRGNGPLARVALPSFVLPTVLLLAVSAVATPVYSPRYLAMCTPFVAVVMAAGVASLRIRMLRFAALAALVALALPQVTLQRGPEAKETSSWQEVATFVAHDRNPDARTAVVYGALAHHASATTGVLPLTYPAAFAGTTDVTLRTPAAARGRLWESRAPLADRLPALLDVSVVYLITSTADRHRAVDAALLEHLGWEEVRTTAFTDVLVTRYER